MRHDETLRKLEVIGQFKNLSEDTTSRRPEVPWTDVGMRDSIIHDSFGVNLEN
jgi:uncharacterized protein with HEPN domain